MAPFAQGGSTGNVKVERIIPRTTGQEYKVNDANTIFAAFTQLHFKSRTTTTAPGSPADNDCYIVPSGSTGYATGTATDDVALWSNGWGKQTPQEGWRGWVEDEDVWVRFVPSVGWVEDSEVGGVATGLTASTTQTQGQGPLTKTVNVVATCANANDVKTLPVPRAGSLCVVANRGAQTLQLFPSSGVSIDTGSADASVTIATGKAKVFFGVSSTNWTSLLGA